MRVFSAGTLLLSIILNVSLFIPAEAKTDCKEERENLCPRDHFSSRSERKTCLMNAINSLPEKCRGALTHSMSNGFVNNSSNFSQLCEAEIRKFCPTKRSGRNMVAGSESACKHTLKRALKRHGYYYISEHCRTALTDGKDIKIHRHNTGYIYYTTKQNKNPLNKELIVGNFYTKNSNKIDIQSSFTNKNNDSQTNNGQYTGSPIATTQSKGTQMNTYITLSNGTQVSVYRYNEFIKDHQEVLRKLTNDERDKYINEYFLAYS